MNTLGLYGIFHLTLSIFALYLSFRCNGRFDLPSFIVALLFPYIYVPYALAISCTGVPIF